MLISAAVSASSQWIAHSRSANNSPRRGQNPHWKKDEHQLQTNFRGISRVLSIKALWGSLMVVVNSSP
jgi:hypothetical protein